MLRPIHATDEKSPSTKLFEAGGSPLIWIVSVMPLVPRFHTCPCKSVISLNLSRLYSYLALLDMPDDSSAAHGGSRDRAFSFECFAFGINADEPLPPLETPRRLYLVFRETPRRLHHFRSG
jgi:hypothetical protein